MNKTVEFHDGAKVDYQESLDYYKARSEAAAFGFVAAIDDTIERIVSGKVPCSSIDARIRYLRVKKYPFRVVFVERPESIVVIAVAHFRRAPGYWRHRI